MIGWNHIGCLFSRHLPPKKRRFNFGSFDTLLHVPLHVLAGGVMRGQEGCDGEAPALRITKKQHLNQATFTRLAERPPNVFKSSPSSETSNPSHSRLSSFFSPLSLSRRCYSRDWEDSPTANPEPLLRLAECKSDLCRWPLTTSCRKSSLSDDCSTRRYYRFYCVF